MKIAVISPNPEHLRQIRALLEARSHSVATAEGGKSRLRTMADQEPFDLMLVDGMCHDPGELAQVESVTASHAGLAVVLMCATHTPEFLLQSMRAGVREVLPSPVPGPALLACVERIESKAAAPAATASPRGKVVAFLSCKGGSGATFLATSLAWQLAQAHPVLLVDLNLQFGDVLSFVSDRKPASTIADVARDIGRLDASLLAASTVKVAPNLSVLAAPEDLGQAVEVKPEHVTAIVRLASTQYDFVLVDVARALEPATICALDHADRVYVVLQSGLPHVRHLMKLLGAFRSLDYPQDKVQVVLNRHEKTADIGVEDIHRLAGGVQIVTVPNSYKEVSAAINQGDALTRTARSSPVARQLAELAASLSPRPLENRNLFNRLFKRA